MAKYVFVYAGGERDQTPEAQQQAMQEWTAWAGVLGNSIIDFGNPFGASRTVKSGGSVDGTASALGGYSVIEAASLQDAAEKATGCPILRVGGTVEVYEALSM